MAIVTALQFSPVSGAMICDEEYWFLRRRRSFFLDNIRNLIPEDISDALNIEAAYGGWGHPGFHEEVIRRSREAIARAFKENSSEGKEKFPLTDLENIALIVRQAMQDTRRRKVDDMLRYLYGFNTDDINQGFWDENGARLEIKQDSVLSDAKKIVNFEKKDSLTEPIFKNKAIVVGYDPSFGYRGFHLNAENTVCSLISGGFEAIGAGLYGAGVEFSRIMNRLTLDERRNGFDRVWGIIALFEATLKAYEHFHEVGGGLNLIYINGAGKAHKDRYMELSDATTRLTHEIIKIYQYGLLTLEQIYPLVENLIFKGATKQAVEEKLFALIPDTLFLRKILRGYKIPPYPSQRPNPHKPVSAPVGSKRGGKQS
jgi:hypothetical protein